VSVLLGILVAGLALALALTVSWVRWRVRDRRLRRERLAERRRFDELERQRAARRDPLLRFPRGESDFIRGRAVTRLEKRG